MASFDVLDPDQFLLEPHFLEASAGTGKTFAIEHIVTRLLLDQELKAECNEILVVTFTRASTRELKMRIRENLCKVLKKLKDEINDQEISYLIPIKASDQKTREAVDKLEEVLCTFDRMQIFTIHGFCQQMLKEHPFEAGVNLSSGSPDQKREKEICQQQVLDFFRTKLSIDLFDKSQIQRVLKKQRFDLQKVVSKVIRIIKQEGVIETPIDYAKTKEEFLQVLKEFSSFVQNPSLLKEEFLLLAPLFKGLCSVKKEIHPQFLEQIDLLVSCYEDLEQSPERLSVFLRQEEFFFDYFQEDFLKKNSKTSFSSLRERFSFFSFVEKMAFILFKVVDPNHILLSMAFHCKQSVEKALDYYGLTPPDSLLKIMKERIEEKSFFEKVRAKYKAALIDEFQDTDPIQWEIFKRLFVEGREAFPLFLVGDPKQSIYGFRNADMPTYLKAAEYFLPHQRMSLDTNYRSEPRLIGALNALFCCSDRWLCQEKELVYEKVKASPFAKDSDFQDGYGPVHFFIADQSGSKERTVPSKEIEEKEFFAFIVQEIDKLKEKGLSYKSFAVLIRDRFQGERLERFLKKKNIPYQATTVAPIKETRAFGFFKLLLKVVGSCDDSSLVKNLLSHPMIGFSHHHLRDQKDGEQFIFALTKLKELSSFYVKEGFLIFWERFLQTTLDLSGQSFERQLLVHGALQDYQDLIQVAELVIESHHRKVLSHQELILLLEDLEQKDPEEEASARRRSLADEEGIHIMTIHKSKGLEFSIVFALGLCVRSSGVQDVIKAKDGGDDELVVFDPSNKNHQQVLEKENKEKMRQLYVALTRAKQRVYIPLCFSAEKESKGNFSPIEIFCRQSFSYQEDTFKENVIKGLGALGPCGISFSENLEFFGVLDNHENNSPKPKLSSVTKFSKNYQERVWESYSSLAKMQSKKNESKSEEKNLLLEGEFPSSAEVGEIFHKILEKIFERGLYLLPNREGVRSLIDQEIGLSCLKGFESQVYNKIETVLDLCFDLNGTPFSFKKIPLSNLTTEMEFFLQEEGMFFKGVVDLFFKYEDKYYLVDWKTNFLGKDFEDYNKKSLEKCMEDHQYFLQASLYSKAIKLFLKKKNVEEEAFGGIVYVFIRGLSRELKYNNGLYII